MKRRAIIVAAVAGLSLGVLGGCVTEGPPPKPLPPPTPTQPSGLKADRVLPMSGQLMADSDRNGYVDAVTVTVYLFARGYDPAIEADGSFEFELRGEDGGTIYKWLIDPPAARAAMKRYPPGPAYQFDLTLLDRAGGDELDRQRGELWTRFLPRDGGPPIEARSPLTLTLGPAPGGR